MKTPFKYNIAFQQYYQNQNSITSNCAEITFINNGTSNMVLNNTLTLRPTQSISISSQQFELDTTTYQIQFDATTGNLCTIVRKYYNDYPKNTTDTQIIHY